jgi:hypothetical protein
VWGYCSAHIARRCSFDLTSVDVEIFVACGGPVRDVSRCSHKFAKYESRYSGSDVFTRGAITNEQNESRFVDDRYSPQSVFFARVIFHTQLSVSRISVYETVSSIHATTLPRTLMPTSLS